MASSKKEKVSRRGASQWAVAWRRFKRNKPGVIGLIMVIILFLSPAFEWGLTQMQWILPARPNPEALKFFYETPPKIRQPPSLENLFKQPFSLTLLFGTTSIGTDVLSEMIHATKYTLYVGILVTLITMALSILVGAIAGFFGGWIDNVLMRTAEVFLVFPSLLLILVFVRIFTLTVGEPFWTIPLINIQIPTGLTIVILVIAIFNWGSNARMIRGEFLRIRELEFVEAERALGASDRRIIFRHILPNILSPVIVISSLTIAYAILLEAAVSFLGFGDVNTITWGQILQENFAEARVVWWAEIFPGLAILFSVFAFNLLGDGLSDALNPRLRE